MQQSLDNFPNFSVAFYLLQVDLYIAVTLYIGCLAISQGGQLYTGLTVYIKHLMTGPPIYRGWQNWMRSHACRANFSRVHCVQYYLLYQNMVFIQKKGYKQDYRKLASPFIRIILRGCGNDVGELRGQDRFGKLRPCKSDEYLLGPTLQRAMLRFWCAQ